MLFFAMSLLRFFTDGPFLSFQSLRITQLSRHTQIQFICSCGIPVSLDTSAEIHAFESKWSFCLIIHFEHLWRFFGGQNVFHFLALQTEIFGYKHCLLSTSSRNPIFSCEQVPQEVFGRFTLHQLSDWKLSERTVKCAKETFKLARAVFTHTDIHSHIQTAQVKANQSLVKLQCLS